MNYHFKKIEELHKNSDNKGKKNIENIISKINNLIKDSKKQGQINKLKLKQYENGIKIGVSTLKNENFRKLAKNSLKLKVLDKQIDLNQRKQLLRNKIKQDIIQAKNLLKR